MPTYEYRCGQCGHRFEEYQTITAKPVEACPACGKGPVERLLGAGAAFLKNGANNKAMPCGTGGPCCGAESPCMHGRCHV